MISRRCFLASSPAIAGFLGLRQLLRGGATAGAAEENEKIGYGPLKADPKGMLDLPRGFSYRVISRAGKPMADGMVTPEYPDGMAAFAGPDGLTVLIRNHELNPDANLGPFGRGNKRLARIDRAKVYDAGFGRTPCLGGTTTLVYNTRKQTVVRQFLSLAGTARNCAGGVTPWNSWITCEETSDRAGKHEKYACEQDHGFNFEVPATAEVALADPVPLKAMGRFRHEAVAVADPTGIVYETEDLEDGLLYRFLPHTPGKLVDGGRLQALALADHPSADTRNWDPALPTIPMGKALPVKWVDLNDVESPNNDLRHQGHSAGAARFARGEGMWYGHQCVFFACTNGGSAKTGQIWRYNPSVEEGRSGEASQPGTLELFIETRDSRLLESADNLTVAPWGDLVVCEDRTTDQVRLVGITPRGRLYTLAAHHLKCEFAGAVFSPDGSTLFVNIQQRGLTLAITGPWHKVA
jgi:secreted PhoX family phosphatase